MFIFVFHFGQSTVLVVNIILAPKFKLCIASVNQIKTETGHEFRNESFAEDYEMIEDAKLPVNEKSKRPLILKDICPQCKKSVATYCLQTHINRIHLKVENYFCDLCDFGSFAKKEILHHIVKHKLHYRKALEYCTYCGKFFKNLSHLKDHVSAMNNNFMINELTFQVNQVHLKKLKYTCDLCGR